MILKVSRSWKMTTLGNKQELKIVEDNGKRYYELSITKRKTKYVIKFDEDDLKLIEPYQWKISKDGYAVTNFVNRNNATIYLNMHKIIYEHYNGKVPEGKDVDHRNNDKLDNRKENLQVLTKSENIKKAKQSKTTHPYIYFDIERQKYRCNWKNKYIGRFSTLDEAILAQKEYINKQEETPEKDEQKIEHQNNP